MVFAQEHSLSGQLVIDRVAVPGGGEIGMTHCPGRNQLDPMGRRWARDLAADLKAIRDWPAGMLVSLIEEQEFDRLGVAGLGAAAQAIGLAWHHLPVRDMHPPDARFETAWQERSAAVDRLFARQELLVLHCAGGLGRTGTLAARILIDHGVPAAEAIETVRAARPGTIETVSQEDYLLGLVPAGTVRPHRRV